MRRVHTNYVLFLLTFLKFYFSVLTNVCAIFFSSFLGVISASINHRLTCLIVFVKHNFDIPWWIIFGMTCYNVMFSDVTLLTHSQTFYASMIDTHALFFFITVGFVTQINNYLFSHSFHCHLGKYSVLSNVITQFSITQS